jgi:WD40 repeat protein
MRCLTIKQLSFLSQIGQLKVEESNYPYTTTGDVTILERSTDKTTVAGGYSSGELRIFNYITKEMVATFRGHRSAVSAVAFERSGSIVASGGRDSDIFLWDLVTLTGEILLLIISAIGQHRGRLLSRELYRSE